MGGENPYVQDTRPVMPTGKYRVTFLPMGVEVEVDPARIPYGHEGRPGSILDIALAHGVNIDHACGGVCACSTCHAIICEGFASLSEPSEEEEDQLENAPGLRPTSRLCCQAVPDGSCDVVVDVPEWNRNLAQEGA